MRRFVAALSSDCGSHNDDDSCSWRFQINIHMDQDHEYHEIYDVPSPDVDHRTALDIATIYSDQSGYLVSD